MTIQLTNIFASYGYSPEQIRVFISQSAHESDFWRSSLFQNARNAYGIKNHKRNIEGKKEKPYKTYASYESVDASVKDFIDLIERRGIAEKADNLYLYVVALKKAKYFEASLKEYTNGMINAYKKLFPESGNKYNEI